MCVAPDSSKTVDNHRRDWFWKEVPAAERHRLYVVYYESQEGEATETTMAELPQLLAAGIIRSDTKVLVASYAQFNCTTCHPVGLTNCWIDELLGRRSGLMGWRTGQSLSRLPSQALRRGHTFLPPHRRCAAPSLRLARFGVQ
eukprot:COSAG01_NODE_378_length_17882_cov_62.690344_9_plen_143_part_00